MANSARSIPQLIAHRGYTRHYPENTLIALQAAIAAGARYVEVDVQLTADGMPVLFHDDTLERVCAAPGAIHDYDALALASLRAFEFDRFGYRYAQTPIARLSDLCALLAAHPQVTAFVELKAISLVRFGIERVLDSVLPALTPLAAQVVLISFERQALTMVRARGTLRIGGVIERWGERGPWRSLDPEFLFCDVQGLPRWGRLHFGNARVAVYEVDTAAIAFTLAARDVELIETFAIGELREELTRS